PGTSRGERNDRRDPPDGPLRDHGDLRAARLGVLRPALARQPPGPRAPLRGPRRRAPAGRPRRRVADVSVPVLSEAKDLFRNRERFFGPPGPRMTREG